MKSHAFVAMPFGTKPGPDGRPINFDLVYTDLIKPAVQDAGCEVIRADEEPRAGDIRKDMFQELLVADLVVVDLTLDNPNVWYELGVRHALRACGVVLIQGPRPTQPFDIYTDRKFQYHLLDGAPDPDSAAADRAAIAQMVRETLNAPGARKVSPVYILLDHLREPVWRDLLLADRNEFSDGYAQWNSRIEIARRKNRAGDILVLAEETPTQALRLEAMRTAGNCLLQLRQFAFALEQFETALGVDPRDKISREKSVICLSRLERYEEARERGRRLTEEYPDDPEVWALAGRLEKENWISRWCLKDASIDKMIEAATAEEASLLEAIEPYHKAFVLDPSHYYSGINSLALHMLQRHLGGQPDETVIANLVGAVLWASLTAQERDKKDYWARASYAVLCLLVNPLDTIIREFRNAVVVANRDWFALDSTRQTLILLRNLAFRTPETEAALGIVDREIARAAPLFNPRRVFLFSGHMMDAADRTIPRFPKTKEAVVAQRIRSALDDFDAQSGDLALSQGSAGGDLLFLEACQERGLRCRLLLPLAEPDFVARSVLPSADGDRWRQRFFEVTAKLADPPRIMPTELGPPPKGVNTYERANQWLLYTALAWGIDKIRFICLWNGAQGDGPGGTAHMYDAVKRRTGRVAWIDTRNL